MAFSTTTAKTNEESLVRDLRQMVIDGTDEALVKKMRFSYFQLDQSMRQSILYSLNWLSKHGNVGKQAASKLLEDITKESLKLSSPDYTGPIIYTEENKDKIPAENTEGAILAKAYENSDFETWANVEKIYLLIREYEIEEEFRIRYILPNLGKKDKKTSTFCIRLLNLCIRLGSESAKSIAEKDLVVYLLFCGSTPEEKIPPPPKTKNQKKRDQYKKKQKEKQSSAETKEETSVTKKTAPEQPAASNINSARQKNSSPMNYEPLNIEDLRATYSNLIPQLAATGGDVDFLRVNILPFLQKPMNRIVYKGNLIILDLFKQYASKEGKALADKYLQEYSDRLPAPEDEVRVSPPTETPSAKKREKTKSPRPTDLDLVDEDLVSIFLSDETQREIAWKYIERRLTTYVNFSMDVEFFEKVKALDFFAFKKKRYEEPCKKLLTLFIEKGSAPVQLEARSALEKYSQLFVETEEKVVAPSKTVQVNVENKDPLAALKAENAARAEKRETAIARREAKADAEIAKARKKEADDIIRAEKEKADARKKTMMEKAKKEREKKTAERESLKKTMGTNANKDDLDSDNFVEAEKAAHVSEPSKETTTDDQVETISPEITAKILEKLAKEKKEKREATEKEREKAKAEAEKIAAEKIKEIEKKLEKMAEREKESDLETASIPIKEIPDFLLTFAKQLKASTGQDVFLIGSTVPNLKLNEEKSDRPPIQINDLDLVMTGCDQELLSKELTTCEDVFDYQYLSRTEFPINKFKLKDKDGSLKETSIAIWKQEKDETPQQAILRTLKQTSGDVSLSGLSINLTANVLEIIGSKKCIKSLSIERMNVVESRPTLFLEDVRRLLRSAMKADVYGFKKGHDNLKKILKVHPPKKCFRTRLEEETQQKQVSKFLKDNLLARYGIVEAVELLAKRNDMFGDMFDALTNLSYESVKETLPELNRYKNSHPYTKQLAFYIFVLAHLCVKAKTREALNQEYFYKVIKQINPKHYLFLSLTMEAIFKQGITNLNDKDEKEKFLTVLRDAFDRLDNTPHIKPEKPPKPANSTAPTPKTALGQNSIFNPDKQNLPPRENGVSTPTPQPVSHYVPVPMPVFMPYPVLCPYYYSSPPFPPPAYSEQKEWDPSYEEEEQPDMTPPPTPSKRFSGFN